MNIPALLLAALLWSTGGFLIKSISWSPLAIVGFRSLIASVVIYFFIPRLRRPTRLQLQGALAYAAVVSLFVCATKLTTAANAIVLQYTAPAFIALFAYGYLGERITRADWFTVGAVFAGLGVFFKDGLSTNAGLGDVLALGSGLAFAWLTLLLRRQKDGNPLESVFWGNLVTSLLFCPVALFVPRPDWHSVGYLGILGVFQLGLPYVLYCRAICHVSALESCLIVILEPLLNPVWVAIMLGEKPSMNAVLGGLLIIGAVTLRSIFAAMRPSQVTAPSSLS